MLDLSLGLLEVNRHKKSLPHIVSILPVLQLLVFFYHSDLAQIQGLNCVIYLNK